MEGLFCTKKNLWEIFVQFYCLWDFLHSSWGLLYLFLFLIKECNNENIKRNINIFPKDKIKFISFSPGIGCHVQSRTSSVSFTRFLDPHSLVRLSLHTFPTCLVLKSPLDYIITRHYSIAYLYWLPLIFPWNPVRVLRRQCLLAKSRDGSSPFFRRPENGGDGGARERWGAVFVGTDQQQWWPVMAVELRRFSDIFGAQGEEAPA